MKIIQNKNVFPVSSCQEMDLQRLVKSSFHYMWLPHIQYLVMVQSGASLAAQGCRIGLPMQAMQVRFLGREDPLEEEMATHSSIFAWEISQIEEPGGLQSMRSQKNQNDLMTKQQQFCRLPPFSRAPPDSQLSCYNFFFNDYLTSIISTMFYLNGSCQTGPNLFFSFVDWLFFKS